VIQFFRAWLQNNPIQENNADLVGALNDDRIGPPIVKIHNEPTRDWSVESLATEVSMSHCAFSLTNYVTPSATRSEPCVWMNAVTTSVHAGIEIDYAKRSNPMRSADLGHHVADLGFTELAGLHRKRLLLGI